MPSRQDPTNAQLAQAMAQMAQVMAQQAATAAAQTAAQTQRDCPNAAKAEPVLNTARGRRPSALGRVFAISGEQAAVTDDLIQGTCVIAGTSLMVLFDSSATYSFIAEECVKKLGLLTADLPFDLVVTTPAADRLVTRTTCLQCPLIYEDRKFFANLVCLGLKELNVILWMDWLTQYHVLLDCANKAVVFPDSGVTDYLNSYTLGKSSPAFVNSVVAEAKNDGHVRNILVVQDFVDVFLEDVPGLQSVRETEFSIDIMPDTGPISMAPYRMAPSELTELAKQLDDLSSKGFIRSSVSPWGAPVLLWVDFVGTAPVLEVGEWKGDEFLDAKLGVFHGKVV
ncbi:uncharacterized protein LOC130719665 [Lotus japonicus]|uniref:uncharacterized protein LOC130719665 n=1 Tax=Lotus japonicus TaxID=34305 RepID=UPI0025879DCB|nr:uncharacterized protein LOC130719665 [Lotus japonicus]